MNAYTIEVYWTTDSGGGVSHVYTEGCDLTEATEKVFPNFERQGYEIIGTGTVTNHGTIEDQSLIDFRHQPCKNGIL